MTVLLLVLWSVIGVVALSSTIRINYHTDQQGVDVTKANSGTVAVEFGDIVNIGNQVEIVYIGNGNWRKKDETSAIWPNAVYQYDAEYIHGVLQFIKTAFQVLDDQLSENQGYLDTTTANNDVYHTAIKTTYNDTVIDFRRYYQYVTIEKDGAAIDVAVGDIVTMNGNEMVYIGNQQWIERDANGTWAFDCASPTISANDFIAIQFELTGNRITSTVGLTVPGLIDDSCATLWGTTRNPTNNPSTNPSKAPSGSPSKAPVSSPSEAPSGSPSKNPSSSPSKAPVSSPSEPPTTSPSKTPSASIVTETTLFSSSNNTDPAVPTSGVQRYSVFGVFVIFGIASCL